MSQFHRSAVQHYSNANQLQGHVGSYLLMFDTLLRLNAEGQKAYLAQAYEEENSVFEKNSRILIGMRALFQQKRNAPETVMFDFFSSLLEETFRFADYDDRSNYYVGLYSRINEFYKIWKQ